MKSKAENQKLRKLSLSVGNFIRYWGFRRVHGAIWTQLYLSKTPLSCTDLASRLNLSKALISPALEELCHYKLIQEAPAPNEKVKIYMAAEDINQVIRHVLKTREAKMLKEITADFEKFNEASHPDLSINQSRVESLAEMIISANVMLDVFLAQKDFLKAPIDLNS